jgi:hypothetical protein
MNWFRENREASWLGILCGGAVLIALILLWLARSRFTGVDWQLSNATSELQRLQSLQPLPNEANLDALKKQGSDYGQAVRKLKQDLQKAVLPASSLAPNEFQVRLRAAVTDVTEKARAAGVKLPDDFFLGFDEFATALPETEEAALLGQQLEQIKLLVDILIDAHIDALTAFRRIERSVNPVPAAQWAFARTAKFASVPENRTVQRASVEVTFTASPAAMRRVVNQIANSERQFFIIRTLHVKNEHEKGPARGSTAPNGATMPNQQSAATAEGKGTRPLNFIVGTEHLQTSATIEMLRFNLGQ